MRKRMDVKKKHYSDRCGENTVHMYTPFGLALGDGYDYLRQGLLRSALYYFFHTLVLLILRPYLLIANGLVIRGRENLKPLRGKGFVAVLNHAHCMDCAMLGCAIGLRRMYYMSAASNFCIPVLRHIVRGLGGVPLDGSPAPTKRFFLCMETALRRGKAVAVYPEGVLLPYCRELRPFRRGAFKLAADADAPVLPVRLTFREPCGIWKYLRRRPFVTVNILRPVWPDAELSARERSMALLAQCRSAMEDAGEAPDALCEAEQAAF